MSEALWAAVDRLTKPSRVAIRRAADADWLADLGESLRDLAAREEGWCSVPLYRSAVARLEAGQTGTAVVPSLWDQSTDALNGGGESGGTGSTLLQERSPADLDLMEIRAIIRDTTRHELAQRGWKPIHGDDPFKPEEIRELGRRVTQTTPADLWWWEYRFDQWGRLLETYLRAVEHHRPQIRLRNVSCPLCRTRWVRVGEDGQLIQPGRPVEGDVYRVSPLVVDFRDGYVRAARCDACGATWFRGDQLHQLAEHLRLADIGVELSDREGTMSA